MKKIAPSILSADFGKLAEEIRAVEEAGADLIHLDIMDGHFVPNITAGPILVEAARRATKLPLDVHLMVETPEKYMPEFVKAGAHLVSVHVEACPKLSEVLQLIKKLGAKASVAINPDTPVSRIEAVLGEIDMALVMTVHPGFAGQEFIASALPKVTELKKIAREKKFSFEIEVDGGIKVENIGACSEAGATVFVAGSAIFKSGDYKKTIAAMKVKVLGECRYD